LIGKIEQLGSVTESVNALINVIEAVTKHEGNFTPKGLLLIIDMLVNVLDTKFLSMEQELRKVCCLFITLLKYIIIYID